MKNNTKEQKRNSENKDKSAKSKTKAEPSNKNSGPEKTQTGAAKKYPVWFYSVPILIPIIFFLLLEGGLRLFHYGKDIETFIKVSGDYPDMLFMNPEVPFRYFSSIKTAPSVIPDGFKEVKNDSTFRVFVLGESSTAGWPYAPNASFSRYLKRKLTLLYPRNNIEIINLGITAVNTYTMRDLLPDVLKQKPDLIIFYNGHNEYYGALGPGSSESIGKSRFLINLMLKLQRFKTFELVKNMVRYFAGIFHGSSGNSTEESGETLMSRMVGQSLIAYNSDTYLSGLKQFEGNMRDMLQMAKEAGIPVILGTLASNLKDQLPFVSVSEPGLERADKVFQEARQYLRKGDYKKAREFFIKAKELDALRFRAPEEINNIIRKLAGEYNCPVAPVEEDFEKSSPDGITGNNLMVDHLHPNLRGYQLMGEAYYNTMKKYTLLPKGSQAMSENSADSTLKVNFPFTRLDSTVSDIRLKILLGAYPFVPKGSPNHLLESLRLNDFVDTLAGMIIDKKTYWETAHIKAAEYFFKKKQFWAFKKEMNAVIEERPFNETAYGFTSEMLIKANLFKDAIPYLKKLQAIKPGAYSTKWLGLLALDGKNYKEALYYLESSLQYTQDDPQVWYNLAGVYFNLKDNGRAIDALHKCLAISPGYNAARVFYAQLMAASRQNKQ
ncbi:MAG: GDSL-type esterase/lipase family protein [Acidobacteriota bacterium]